jgi:RNA polymerase sigma-70 factor (ECF subfamily)
MTQEDWLLGECEADGTLVGQAVAGDRAAFAALCDRHRLRIWRVVVSIARGPDAEDLAQEAVIRAFCALGQYRADAPFAAWLCRIALNLAHDYQRSAWRRRVTLCAAAPPDEADGESADGEVARREVRRRVRLAVARLPASQRVPIWLHYFEEFPIAQVARLEGTSESTIRSRVRAGLRRLSFSLEDLLESPTPAPLAARVDAKGCGA